MEDQDPIVLYVDLDTALQPCLACMVQSSSLAWLQAFVMSFHRILLLVEVWFA
jgi:hypothetical protein